MCTCVNMHMESEKSDILSWEKCPLQSLRQSLHALELLGKATPSGQQAPQLSLLWPASSTAISALASKLHSCLCFPQQWKYTATTQLSTLAVGMGSRPSLATEPSPQPLIELTFCRIDFCDTCFCFLSFSGILFTFVQFPKTGILK